MGQKPSFWPNPKLFRKGTSAQIWPAIPRQQIELQNCSNPVMTSGVVEFRIKKTNFTFKCGVLGQWDHDGGMFLGYLCDFIIRSHAPIFWLAVFLDSMLKYVSLEPLIKFLAFLVQKLCQKYSENVRNVPGD